MVTNEDRSLYEYNSNGITIFYYKAVKRILNDDLKHAGIDGGLGDFMLF